VPSKYQVAELTSGTVRWVDLGYARVSTTKQDLERQIDALTKAGVAPEQIYVDKKSGATTDRPGLRGLLGYAREGDVVVVHTLDRLGRTVRDTLNLVHDLSERGIGVRNLADPVRVDSTKPDDPMAQLTLLLLALFAQMERTYTLERAAHARAVAAAKGRRVGRPSVVEPSKLGYATHLRDSGCSMAEIVAKTGITRSSLYRHLPPRPPEVATANGCGPPPR
jgi:DNA invertase Pin-like site-specific DNA recombinase